MGRRTVCSQVWGDGGCLIGIKSDTLIQMVALTNVDFRTGSGYGTAPSSLALGHARVGCN